MLQTKTSMLCVLTMKFILMHSTVQCKVQYSSMYSREQYSVQYRTEQCRVHYRTVRLSDQSDRVTTRLESHKMIGSKPGLLDLKNLDHVSRN